MDLNKLNIDISGLNIVSKSPVLKIDFIPNRIKFNLMESLPPGAILKKQSLSLFDPTRNNKILDVGLAINTDKFLDDVYPSLVLKGNILYEYKDKSYEIPINNKLTAGQTNDIVTDVKHLSDVTFNTDEDVINYLLAKIEALESKVLGLELRM